MPQRIFNCKPANANIFHNNLKFSVIKALKNNLDNRPAKIAGRPWVDKQSSKLEAIGQKW